MPVNIVSVYHTVIFLKQIDKFMTNKEKNSNIKDAVEITTELVKAVPIYQDLIQPAAKEIGTALGTVAKTINIALAPISATVWSFETFQEFISTRVAKKLKTTPQECISTPPLSVIGPALDSLRYSNEDELQEMYANLLANALDTRTSSNVHPSFVEIIKQLSPQEALLLKSLSETKSFPEICYFDSVSTAKYITSGYAKPMSGVYDSAFTYSEIDEKFSLVAQQYVDEKNIQTALDNFKRLNLVEVDSHTEQTFTDSKHHINEEISLQVALNEVLRFSSFGISFVRTCIINKI